MRFMFTRAYKFDLPFVYKRIISKHTHTRSLTLWKKKNYTIKTQNSSLNFIHVHMQSCLPSCQAVRSILCFGKLKNLFWLNHTYIQSITLSPNNKLKKQQQQQQTAWNHVKNCFVVIFFLALWYLAWQPNWMRCLNVLTSNWIELNWIE